MLTLLKFCAAALVSTKAVHSVAPLLFPTYTDFDQWRYIYTIGERDLGRSAKCLAYVVRCITPFYFLSDYLGLL